MRRVACDRRRRVSLHSPSRRSRPSPRATRCTGRSRCPASTFARSTSTRTIEVVVDGETYDVRPSEALDGRRRGHDRPRWSRRSRLVPPPCPAARRSEPARARGRPGARAAAGRTRRSSKRALARAAEAPSRAGRRPAEGRSRSCRRGPATLSTPTCCSPRSRRRHAPARGRSRPLDARRARR